MVFQRTSKIRALVCGVLAVAGVFAHATPSLAQTQGINGFDWIGTDPQNINTQRCYASNLWEDTNYNRTVTAWTPPASGTPKQRWSYSMNTFRAQVGSINTGVAAPQHPGEYADWQLYVYDSLAAMRGDANNAYRARFNFSQGSSGISYEDSYICHYWVGGFTSPIPCYRLNLNLSLATNATYKTASGQVTQTPLKLNGGTRYFFSLVGYHPSFSSTDIPCVVRTAPGLAQTFSPIPTPALTIALNPQQQAESQLPLGTPFTLAHSDFQMFSPGMADQNRTPVNYLPGFSQLPPYIEWTGYGTDPRTCGLPYAPPCPLRTQSARWAEALGVTRIITYTPLYTTKAYLAIADRVEVCPSPSC